MKDRDKTYNMVVTAVLAGVICVLGPFSIPLGPEPVTLTNLALYFAIYIIGARKTFISYFVYFIIGLAGLPVFSGFMNGPEKLLGPTGGYTVGFFATIAVGGIVVDAFKDSKIRLGRVICFLGLCLGTALCYACGTLWYYFSSGVKLLEAVIICVPVYIPGDIIKILAAVWFAPVICKRLEKANLTADTDG